jgi:hypothetical protein
MQGLSSSSDGSYGRKGIEVSLIARNRFFKWCTLLKKKSYRSVHPISA